MAEAPYHTKTFHIAAFDPFYLISDLFLMTISTLF
jgi:hypothetical protein